MRGLFIALALALTSCAAPPPPAPRPAPARPQVKDAAQIKDDFRIIAEAFRTVRDNYVTGVDEDTLAASCTSGMRQHLATVSPPLDAATIPPRAGSARERIAGLYVDATQRRPDLDRRALVDACLTPMLSNLDKLSSYLNREAYRELQVGTGPAAAIGIELKVEGGFPVVVSAIEGTPAARAGMAAGDVILAIDGVATEKLPLEEVVRRLRGRPKSTVVLALRSAGSLEQSRRELTREIIRIQSVRSRTTPEGYAYIRVSQFQERTLEDFARALKSANRDGEKPVPGIILDLRNSPGGLLNTAVGIPAAFLPATALVTELKGRIPDSNRRMYAAAQDYLRSRGADPLKDLPEAVRNAPLVVIVNSKTGSGAELVAAALQDHGRAKVIGEPTFGVGTIQTIIPADGSSAIKLTTAKFYRPRGDPVEGNPVIPDVALPPVEAALPVDASAPDPALARARALLSK